MPTSDALTTNNQFDALFDCFVISLKRTPERLQSFRDQNSESRIDFRYFEAVDGAQIKSTDIEGRVIASGTSSYSRGVLGNAMSHLALWQNCVDQTKNYAVFEDDAVVRNDIKVRLASLVRQIDDWDIILLGYNTDVPLELIVTPGVIYGGGFSVPYPTAQHLSDFANSSYPVGLHRLSMAMGSCAYALTPKGARTLIDRCFPMDNRTVYYDLLRYAFRAHSLDSMMATVYPKISAFACVAPLVMTANDKKASTTSE